MKQHPLNTPSTDDPWQDLVVAILAVNRYSLERTYTFAQGLRKQGLFDPHNLATLDLGDIVARLQAGGYRRGQFMSDLFAVRLMSRTASYARQRCWSCCGR